MSERFNYAEDYGVQRVLAELPNVSGARLLTAFAMFLNKPGSFVLPFDVDGKQYTVNQGAERMVVFGKIVEALGARLDG